jgi:hypothetical protein
LRATETVQRLLKMARTNPYSKKKGRFGRLRWSRSRAKRASALAMTHVTRRSRQKASTSGGMPRREFR